MKTEIRKANNFLRNATRKDIDDVLSKIVLTDRQEKIFEMCCIRNLGIMYTADMIGVCFQVVNKELRVIKGKIFRVLEE